MLCREGMTLKSIAGRMARTLTQPDCALVLELASAALLFAWMAHTAVE